MLAGVQRVPCTQAEAGARRVAEEDDSDEEGGEGGGSKRKKRLEARMHIGSLKQAAPRPDVVEVWDVTSTDPKLLVWLKVRSQQHDRTYMMCATASCPDAHTRAISEPCGEHVLVQQSSATSAAPLLSHVLLRVASMAAVASTVASVSFHRPTSGSPDNSHFT